ncbi:MAG: NAD(P)-dependent malic enzyme [Candidatus Woesearchaeota archaeon]
MDYDKKSLEMHERLKGKISTKVDFEINTKDDLSIAYTPGIAAVSKAIIDNENNLRKFTSAGKTVAVISNGTSVLGLGDVGAKAAYPVMEGKSALFKAFGGVDSIPICVDIKDVDAFINFVEKVSINFAGINLEDIKAPECFFIEKKLKERLSIPVFHDDQHGTAVVVGAALDNSLGLAGKKLEDIKIVISGAGSAGIAICKLLKNMGATNIFLMDSKGLVTNNRNYGEFEFEKKSFATDSDLVSLSDVIKDADVFIGVSKPGILTKDHVKSMNSKPIVFGLSNPIPEIMPKDAKDAGAFIVATGRSDFDNQINNVLAFPGIFKGALSVNATNITEEMKVAAVKAISSYHDASIDSILPSSLDKNIHGIVAKKVANSWLENKKS